MTTIYSASDVADSFEDLSSLSSDKDIESLVLATTYSDNDGDEDLGKNIKSINDSSNSNSETGGPAKKEEEGQEGKENQNMDDTGRDDEDFVDLAGADMEDDEEDVFSEGWGSSRSTTPEPQDVHQALSSWSDLTLLENQTTSRLPENDSINNSKDSITVVAAMANTSTKTNNNPTPTASSSIPRIRKGMTRDILAKLSKPTPSASVAIASSLSPDRVVATPSRLRLTRQKATKISTTSVTATATATTPESGNVPSPQDKKDVEPKKTVLVALPATSSIDETPAPETMVEPPVSTATPADTTTTTTITDNTQTQEEGDGICKAIRRSTGKRCIRSGRHDGYCSTHRLLVKKVSDSH